MDKCLDYWIIIQFSPSKLSKYPINIQLSKTNLLRAAKKLKYRNSGTILIQGKVWAGNVPNGLYALLCNGLDHSPHSSLIKSII